MTKVKNDAALWLLQTNGKLYVKALNLTSTAMSLRHFYIEFEKFAMGPQKPIFPFNFAS